MNRSRRAPIALSLAFAASLSAQSVSTPPSLPPGGLPPLRTPIHTQPDDEGVPYGTWAAGACYKASFDGGMTFVPFAGKDQPPCALTWRTTSARVGEHELATHAPQLRTTAWRAEYDLGGLVEAYDVQLDGLEQTFVVKHRPAAAGDLVIRGAVTTALQASVAADGSVAFVDAAGQPRIGYGAAVAIDANGRSAPLTATLDGGAIELRLPAVWLATAAFPLVVDPLVTAVSVNSGVTVTQVAVAHDPLGSANVWYAVVRALGADTDLWLYRCDEDGQNPVLVHSDLSANWATDEPSLGVSRSGGATLLAFTRHTYSSDTRRVRLHVHDRNNLAFDANWFHADGTGLNAWRPVVGSDLSASAPTTLLLAFQVETTGAFANIATSKINAYYVDVATQSGIGLVFPVADDATADIERPTIAKVALGASRVWTVGYQRATNTLLGGTWDVALRRVDGTQVSSEFVIDSLFDRHEFAPHLAGLNGRLFLCYLASTTAQQLVRPTGDAGHSIRGVRLDWNGATFVQPHGPRVLQANNDPRLQLGGVDYDTNSDSHWAMSFRSNVTETIYVRTYGFSGSELVAETVETPSVAIGTSVAGGLAFQANDDEFLIAYGMNNPPATSPARLRRLTYPSLLGVTNTGTACTTTQLDWFGTQWIGTEYCGVSFQGAPANSFTAVLAATNFASLQLFGVGGVHDGCWLLVPLAGPDHLGMLGPIVGANGYWQLPLPEALGTQVLRFQAVTFDAATSEFYSSNRLNVPIGK